jgi:phosphatidylglycerol:prolipoprotein diacylglycerol transferase
VLCYLGLYSLGRFFVEGLRIDSLMLGPLRAAQVVSLALMAASLLGLGWLFFIRRRPERR